VSEKNEVKPWLREQWCIPPGASAEFVCAMEDVLEVYHRPYDERRPLVTLDEASKQLVGEAVEPIPAAPDQPRSQPEVGEDGQPEQQDQHDADGAQRDGSRSHRQNAAPRRGHRGFDLQLTVRDRAISEQLSGRVGRDAEETGFVKQNREQEWQQSHRSEVEGDRDGLVVAAIQ